MGTVTVTATSNIAATGDPPVPRSRTVPVAVVNRVAEEYPAIVSDHGASMHRSPIANQLSGRANQISQLNMRDNHELRGVTVRGEITINGTTFLLVRTNAPSPRDSMFVEKKFVVDIRNDTQLLNFIRARNTPNELRMLAAVT